MCQLYRATRSLSARALPHAPLHNANGRPCTTAQLQWRATICGRLGCGKIIAFDHNPDLAAEANKGGRTTVPISNIMGFFIEGMAPDNKGVVGRLMTMPSLQVASGGEVTPDAAFMYTIQLVR